MAEQRRDPNSLLNWTERIIRMRKEVPEIGLGRLTVLKTGTTQVLACRYEWRNNAVLFLHNFASDPVQIKFRTDAAAEKGQNLINLLSDDHSKADAKGTHALQIEAYGYRWYRVGGLDYLLRRTDV